MRLEIRARTYAPRLYAPRIRTAAGPCHGDQDPDRPTLVEAAQNNKKLSNAAASSPSLPSCQHASHKPQRRVLPSLRQWRKRSTGKTDHTTATCTVTLPAHFVSPLIRDNALASKVGSPCPKFPRSASCGCDSGRIRVPVQGLGSNACSLRGKAAIWDACHVDSRHPVGVPVVTDKRHHATPLHFKLHCTAASAGGGWSRRATKSL